LSHAGLSGKQWDIALKALGKLGLTKVTKTEDGLKVEVV
jgi:lysyl-tRNA synthetase, class II